MWIALCSIGPIGLFSRRQGYDLQEELVVLHRIIYSRNDVNEVVTKQIRDTRENNLSTC